MYRWHLKKRKGFTLIETIVTIGIITVVMLGFTLLFTRLWRVFGFTMETGIATFIASRGVEDAVEHIRTARQSENGSFPLISAEDNEFIFYSDYDGDSVVERVRYFGENQQLKVGIVEPDPSVFPVTYDGAETIKTLSDDVVNDVVLNATTCNEYNLTSEIDGTNGNPFTSIGMARGTTFAGEYFFSLGGGSFSTQVDSDGWVLVAAGDSSTNDDDYNQVTSLDYDSDDILTASIMGNLGSIDEVRIEAANEAWYESYLPFDVVTTDVDIIARLKAFEPLGDDTSDNAVWTGSNTARMTIVNNTDAGVSNDWPAACDADASVYTLDEHLYYACGNTSGFVWSHEDGPAGLRKEEARRDNDDNDLNLYVRSTSEPSTFNISATRQLDDSFLGSNSVSYTESQLNNLSALCVDGDTSVDRPIFEYYKDFAGFFESSGADFDYADIELNSMTTPVTSISDVNLVKILLHVNPDPLRAPDNIRLQSFVNIRNLSTYDSTSR